MWWNVGLLLLAVAVAGLLPGFVKQFAEFLRVGSGLRSIPGPSGSNFLLGHALPLLRNCAWVQMQQWVEAQPPIIKVRVLFRWLVIVGSPEAAKRIYQTRQRAYEKDLEWSYGPFLPLLGTGLLTANGDLWQRQRLLIGPAMRGEMLAAVIPITVAATQRMAAKLEAVRGTRRGIDVSEEFRLLTLQVIGQAMLSLPPEECNRVFPELYLPVMEENNIRVLRPWRPYLPLPATFGYRRKVAQLNAYLTSLIRKRWAARQAGDVAKSPDTLDRVLQAIEERGEKWSSALETQLCYEFKTFVLAGHETSAAMLTWTVYQLTQHPHCLAKVREEADRVLGADGGRVPSLDDVEGMQYTLSCLKETLRRFPPVPLQMRKVAEPDRLCGHDIPRGAWIAIQTQAVHDGWRDYQQWRPERFMPGGDFDQYDESIRPYMFLPFIQGPRNCLGQFFALMEARVVLAVLVQKFKFMPVRADAGVPHPTVIPINPKHGMEVFVE